MATTLEKFDSQGGFSLDKTVVIDEARNCKNLNSLELKNSYYSDSMKTSYILRGINTAVLQVDNVGTQIVLENNTLSFIDGHFIAVNPAGTVHTGKLETAVKCDNLGNVSILSTFETVIKDDIPAGETWSIVPQGATNRFSYSTTRAGTTETIKWAVCTEVHSIVWS